ncbi:uncharacterized membrane protein HdeD (DUF308 family) [Bacilli bacterium PM5-9]|nr:uncharacterized membrane protein HdeD (DUF308 family) [Bacilli bacterium PM5-9]
MKSRTSSGWIEILCGVVFILLAFYAFSHPAATLGALVVVFSIGAIFKGVSNIFLYNTLSSISIKKPYILIVTGILNILIGIIFLFKIKVGALTLTALFSIWFIIICISHLTNLYVFKEKKSGYYWFTLIINGIGLVIAFWLLFNPIASAATIIYLVSFYLMLTGIFSITYGFSDMSKK